MIVRLLVDTPPGRAEGAEKMLRSFLLGFHKPVSTGFSDTGFFWELDLTIKQLVSLNSKVGMFSRLAGLLVDNRVFRGAVKQLGAKPEEIAEVRRLLIEGTRVTIIKTAEAQEWDGNKTRWERIKEKFKRS